MAGMKPVKGGRVAPKPPMGPKSLGTLKGPGNPGGFKGPGLGKGMGGVKG